MDVESTLPPEPKLQPILSPTNALTEIVVENPIYEDHRDITPPHTPRPAGLPPKYPVYTPRVLTPSPLSKEKTSSPQNTNGG